MPKLSKYTKLANTYETYFRASFEFSGNFHVLRYIERALHACVKYDYNHKPAQG